MSATMANDRLAPNVLWAQRTDKLYVTIQLEDCKNPEIKLEKNKLHFVGKGGALGKEYEVTIEFYGEIDPETSKYAVLARNVPMVLMKKEDGPYWPRLLKEGKMHNLKTDFDKWRDEDDSEDEKDDRNFEDMMSQMSMGGGMGGMGGMPGMGGMGGMPGMGGMGGMPGMPGMPGMGGGDMPAGFGAGGDSEDSDDEELPDLADVN